MQRICIDHIGKIGLIRDIEKYARDARNDCDDEELDERERVECCCEWKRTERERANEIARDHQPAARPAIDPHAGEDAEHRKRNERCRAERADFECTRV